MDIKFSPPTLIGSDGEKLKQLEAWVRNLCERLNIAFESVKEKNNG